MAKNQWYTSSTGARKSPKKSPRRVGAKKHSPKRKSPSKKSPRRAGHPDVPAKTLTPGTKRKGRDGHFYKVMMRSNGVHYWQKCGAKADGGSYCRFVGPARPRQ